MVALCDISSIRGVLIQKFASPIKQFAFSSSYHLKYFIWFIRLERKNVLTDNSDASLRREIHANEIIPFVVDMTKCPLTLILTEAQAILSNMKSYGNDK